MNNPVIWQPSNIQIAHKNKVAQLHTPGGIFL